MWRDRIRVVVVMALIVALGAALSCADQQEPSDAVLVSRRSGTIPATNGLYARTYRSVRTGKCYIGIYNVGLVEAPAEECK